MRLLALAGPVLLGAALGGCASSSSPLAGIPVVGPSPNAPPPPATPGQYLPVHDIPPPRDATVLDPAARDRLEKELLAARDRQVSGAKAAQRRSGGGN